MIKFRIHPKIEEGQSCKFWKVLRKYQNYRFLDIFLDILHKMEENLDQEHVKRGASILPGQKLEQFPLISLDK